MAEELWSGATIGARLKHVRELRELTQAELARLLGVAVMTVSQWETNRKTPSADILGGVWAKVLGSENRRKFCAMHNETGERTIPSVLWADGEWIANGEGRPPEYSRKINGKIRDVLNDMIPLPGTSPAKAPVGTKRQLERLAQSLAKMQRTIETLAKSIREE